MMNRVASLLIAAMQSGSGRAACLRPWNGCGARDLFLCAYFMRRAGHASDVPEGPGNGVVLVAGDNHRVPGGYQASDGDVQAVGGVGRQDQSISVRRNPQ